MALKSETGASCLNFSLSFAVTERKQAAVCICNLAVFLAPPLTLPFSVLHSFPVLAYLLSLLPHSFHPFPPPSRYLTLLLPNYYSFPLICWISLTHLISVFLACVLDVYQ